MRFANPEAFLLFIPLIVLLLFIYLIESRRVKRLRNLFSIRNLEKMKISYTFSLRGFLSRLFLFIFLGFLIISLSRPQTGQGEREEVTSEHSIVFLIDLSRSMLSTDVSPSRLTLTKQEIIKALDKLNGVKVGLVAFAGNAAVISPMTADLSALKMYLESLSTDTISSQGTEIFAALGEAKAMFDRIAEKEKLENKSEKIIVLFSDGENHQEASVEQVKSMSKEGFRVFSVGVGTEAGGYIPKFEGARDYIKSGDGQLVVTKPNYKFLKEIARAGKGSFYNLNPLSPFSFKLQKDLEKIESINNTKRKFIVKNEVFQIPAYIGFIFFFLYLLFRIKK